MEFYDEGMLRKLAQDLLLLIDITDHTLLGQLNFVHDFQRILLLGRPIIASIQLPKIARSQFPEQDEVVKP